MIHTLPLLVSYVISGGSNGNTYQCTASNGAAPGQSHTVELKGIPQMHDVLSEYVYTLQQGFSVKSCPVLG